VSVRTLHGTQMIDDCRIQTLGHGLQPATAFGYGPVFRQAVEHIQVLGATLPILPLIRPYRDSCRSFVDYGPTGIQERVLD
jgi:hypothetical protein